MKLIRVHERDNVALVLTELHAGEEVELPWGGRLKLRETIPVSHKVTLEDIPAGKTVWRYGQPIGTTTEVAPMGSWVHDHNLKAPEEVPPPQVATGFDVAQRRLPGPDVFPGYTRPKGPPGVRNHLLVMPVVACANGTVRAIGRAVPEAVTVEHAHGCGRVGKDNDRAMRVLSGCGTHPNTGAVVLVGLGCELLNGQKLAEEIAASGRPVEFFEIQKSGGSRKTVEKGIKLAKALIDKISSQAREPHPMSELILGLQCGGSDALSGVTANPTVGIVSDWAVGHGGTVIMAETTEMIGTMHLLQARAKDAQVAERIRTIINNAEELAREMLGDKAHLAIAPGNMDGGLSSIMEKSLGCIVKGGRSVIQEVIRYADRPSGRGLVLMDTPGYDIESLGGLLGAGCQVCLFTTGRGSPVGAPLMPTIKISSNTAAWQNMGSDIDVNAGQIADGQRSLEEMGRILWDYMVEVLGGKPARAEENEQDTFGISMTRGAG